MTMIARLLQEDHGVSKVEFGLIAAATALAVAAILPILGSSLSATFTAFGGTIE